MNDRANFTVEKNHHIARLTLNRPEKRNAAGLAFFRQIAEWFDDFDRDPDVRVVIIKAEGKSFGDAVSKLSGRTRPHVPKNYGTSAKFNQN